MPATAVYPMTKKQPLNRAALGNTMPAPLAPTPLQAPNLPPSPAAPNFSFTPPNVGPAPTATPYGNFTAPDPTKMAADPYFQFRLNNSLKGIERRAASRGTLLSGGLQGRLVEEAGNMAGAEGENIYRRAANDYTLNRDTNQQNYGQQMASYNAGTGAALDSARLGLSGETARYDRAYGAGRDTFGDERDAAIRQSGVINANAQAEDVYRQMMEDYRAALAAQEQADGPIVPVRRPLPGLARRKMG